MCQFCNGLALCTLRVIDDDGLSVSCTLRNADTAAERAIEFLNTVCEIGRLQFAFV